MSEASSEQPLIVDAGIKQAILEHHYRRHRPPSAISSELNVPVLDVRAVIVADWAEKSERGCRG